MNFSDVQVSSDLSDFVRVVEPGFFVPARFPFPLPEPETNETNEKEGK